MPVRKTESRLPQGLTAPQLGQSVQSNNGQLALVSYLSSPLAVGRKQHYVVFVTNGATVSSYEWTITNGGAPATQSTSIGYLEFLSPQIGGLTVSVRIMNAATLIEELTLNQNVVALNADLEAMVNRTGRTYPEAANPEVSREVINDLRQYVDQVVAPASNDILSRLMLSWIYNVVGGTNMANRDSNMETLAGVLEGASPQDFVTHAQARDGFGICKIRPHVLAMVRHASVAALAYRAFPNASAARTTAINTYLASMNTSLTLEQRIDLFNLIRFPKTAIVQLRDLLELLRTQFEPTMDFRELYNNPARLKVLITQLNEGPVTGLSASRQSTSIFNLMHQLVWQIPAVGGVSNAPGGLGGIFRVGEPEKIAVPPRAYIAAGNDQFLVPAQEYHERFGIATQRFNSIQHLLELLDQDDVPLRRVRIVSHAHDTNLATPFFTGAQVGAMPDYFQHFAVSDTAGVRFLLDPVEFFNYRSTILRVLREPARRSVLTPFGLESSGTPADDVLELFKLCNAFNFFRIGTVHFNSNRLINATERADILAGYELLFEEVRTRLTGTTPAGAPAALTAAHINSLRTAIVALDNTASQLNIISLFEGTYNIDDSPGSTEINRLNSLHFALIAFQGGFRARLNRIRARITSETVLEIRGCRYGAVANNLQRFSEFFGAAGNLPHVSAPNLFQGFFTFRRYQGYIANTGAGGIDDLIDNGFVHTGTGPFTVSSFDVDAEFTKWRTLAQTDAQLAFLTTQFGLSDMDFFRMDWANNLPAIAMPALYIDEFPLIAFSEKINRLKDIFDISGGDRITSAEMSTLNTLSQKTTELRAIENSLNSNPGTNFNEWHRQLRLIATAVGGNAIVPEQAPAGVDLAACQNYVNLLTTHIAGRLAPITRFKTALAASAAHAKAQNRYYLRIGLPLILKFIEGTRSPYSFLYWDSLGPQALRTFLKIQNEGTLPVANQVEATAISDLNSHPMFPLIVDRFDHEDHNSSFTDSFLCPLPEYNQHIINHP